jgi:hypothetical protein
LLPPPTKKFILGVKSHATFVPVTLNIYFLSGSYFTIWPMSFDYEFGRALKIHPQAIVTIKNLELNSV